MTVFPIDHTIKDAPGNPLSYILADGQASDIKQGENLLPLTNKGATTLVGDNKGYDSDASF